MDDGRHIQVYSRSLYHSWRDRRVCGTACVCPDAQPTRRHLPFDCLAADQKPSLVTVYSVIIINIVAL